MPGSLQLSSGFLHGIVGGRILQCRVTAPMAGSGPAAGLYHIHRPVQDPIYGQVAFAVAAATSGRGVSVAAIFKFFAPQAGPSAFVLSSRPIPGRNCIVVQRGFADLMEALNLEGSATVTVS